MSCVNSNVHGQRPHDGSELTIHSIVNFGNSQEVVYEHRQFLKGRNFIIDCFIPYWKPSWLYTAIPQTLFSDLGDDCADASDNLAVKLCTFRSDSIYINAWANQIRIAYGKLHPYHMNVVRPESVKAPNQNLMAEFFPVLQVQQDHLQELAVIDDAWKQTWPNFVSFVGDVDTHTFTLKPGLLDDVQLKLSSFVRLYTYTNNPSGRPPNTGYHSFHVFVLFPIAVNPWMSFWKSVRERQDSKGPFQGNRLIFITGSIVGTLSPDCVNEKLQGHEQIIIVVPHSHHVIPSTAFRPSQGISKSGPPTPSTARSSPKGISRFKAPVPISDVQIPSPSQTNSLGSWTDLTQKASDSTPLKEERHATPPCGSSAGSGFDLDIDGFSNHAAIESRESIRAGKKRKVSNEDKAESEKTGRPGTSTTKRTRHRK